MKIPIELSRKKSVYSVYVYGALGVRLFPNKHLNLDLKNIEICFSHGLKTNLKKKSLSKNLKKSFSNIFDLYCIRNPCFKSVPTVTVNK